jgi:ribonuclease HI
VNPKPQSRPPRIDGIPVLRAPVATIAIAVCRDRDGMFRYHAIGAQESWSGLVEAPSKDAAIFDAMTTVWTAAPKVNQVRFLLALPAASPLWRNKNEIEALLPGASVEFPGLSGLPLIEAAKAGLAPAAKTPDSERKPCLPMTDVSPLTVATDGSVRGSFTGFGWLASDGRFGLLGFRHSKRQVGAKVVLISELRAIGDAVRKLPLRPLTLISDSKSAIRMVTQWMDGEDVLPFGYTTERDDGEPAGLVIARHLIYLQRDRLTLHWFRGHQGEPLNEGADALARLARRRAASPREVPLEEYRDRAKGLADAFAKEFRRLQEVGELPFPVINGRFDCSNLNRHVHAH